MVGKPYYQDFQDVLLGFPDNNAFTETTAAFIITGTDTESPANGSGFYSII